MFSAGKENHYFAINILGIIPYVDFDWSPHFEPRCASRYPIISLSPIRHPSVMQHENFSTKEIVTDLFERTNILSANLPVFFTKKPLFSAISVSSSDTKVRQYQRGHTAAAFEQFVLVSDSKSLFFRRQWSHLCTSHARSHFGDGRSGGLVLTP